MNKVIIECTELVDKYELRKEDIIKQLETIKIEKDQDFVIAYDKDFRERPLICVNRKFDMLLKLEITIGDNSCSNFYFIWKY